MDGHAVESELGAVTGNVRFSLATAEDDADVRRLLRENPMPGRVSISLEREPDAGLAATAEGELHRTIIARDAVDGRMIALDTPDNLKHGGGSLEDVFMRLTNEEEDDAP